jgi:hypothetical protein
LGKGKKGREEGKEDGMREKKRKIPMAPRMPRTQPRTNPSSTSEAEDWARVGHPGAMGKEERGREVTGNECLRKIIDSRRWLKQWS